MGVLAPNLVFPLFINNFDPNHFPEIKNVKFIDVIVESPISPIGDELQKIKFNFFLLEVDFFFYPDLNPRVYATNYCRQFCQNFFATKS